ncbi:MAG: preprotein translocase subunit SecE [Methylophilales bacterium RIFCSPHIGHO2_02_FULL_57_10]|nr:MAG: preprotein translocase subunit SecE [Methylophilales bacterium RIFCSPHIGHO2_02_FULL_57_10]
MMDKIRLALALLLVAAGIGGFYLLGDKAAVLRALSVLIGMAAAVAVMWTTSVGRESVSFIQEAVAEARKVVWPSRKETIQTTGVVFALVLLMGIILWVVDFSLLWLIKLILGRDA